MKSTGEVLGIAPTLTEALYKGLTGAGYLFRQEGGVLFTVRDTDKKEAAELARRFLELGFSLYATAGTAQFLRTHAVPATLVHKSGASEHDTLALLESGKISYLVSTSAKGRIPSRGSVKVRRKAVSLGIPCFTSLDTASALVRILGSGFDPDMAAPTDILTLPYPC